MTISAKIIADSISPEGKRITSMQLRYPKFVHGEMLTHRVFSRNAASSRAIPVDKMIKDVMNDPAMPVHWGKNQKGMQADVEMTPAAIAVVKRKWLAARDDAVAHAESLMQDGLHKQDANRVLEPYFHISVLVTATEWDNFFALRCHKDAQPEMRVLAEAMAEAEGVSQPRILRPGDWHLPYVTTGEEIEFGMSAAIMSSVARCARVSYLTQDGQEPSQGDDVALFERLMSAEPPHASPAEHQATPDILLDVMGDKQWQHEKQWRNFRGWRQFRALLEDKAVDFSK